MHHRKQRGRMARMLRAIELGGFALLTTNRPVCGQYVQGKDMGGPCWHFPWRRERGRKAGGGAGDGWPHPLPRWRLVVGEQGSRRPVVLRWRRPIGAATGYVPASTSV